MTSDHLHITLVACGARKLDRPAPARDLYIGDLFRKARAIAETADRWYILSARHRLVHPDTVLDPYDQTLTGMTVDTRRWWARHVDCSLRCDTPNLTGYGGHDDIPDRLAAGTLKMRGWTIRVTVLAGADYREHLLPLLRGWATVDVPLAGLAIGQQKAALAAMR